MLDQQSFSNCTCHNLEKVALQRLRSLALCIPPDCEIFREPWGCSTVLCLNFQACPSKLKETQNQAHLIVIAARYLGLANSVTFRIGNQVMGWTDKLNYC
ncbi:hypothetical protein [Gloeocapsa sp. PCC 73106]|uniref:hypothetical protein n=1 Tax=Gloeocapsa sp. PCC 73106 TaxID=102232 RepID=UPI0002AC342C|nr:hypothetical protein [Gloeocapsa sp. PCC 73106]ELR97190.1 hypothetical protein GLO73106DRAFT_00009950 [Gloeocapsa sp. PCC 73106]